MSGIQCLLQLTSQVTLDEYKTSLGLSYFCKIRRFDIWPQSPFHLYNFMTPYLEMQLAHCLEHSREFKGCDYLFIPSFFLFFFFPFFSLNPFHEPSHGLICIYFCIFNSQYRDQHKLLSIKRAVCLQEMQSNRANI